MLQRSSIKIEQDIEVFLMYYNIYGYIDSIFSERIREGTHHQLPHPTWFPSSYNLVIKQLKALQGKML